MMQDKVASKVVQNFSASLVALDKAICCIKEDIVSLTEQIGGDGMENIYNADGALTENRILTGAGNNLTLTGIGIYTLSAGALSVTALSGAATYTIASALTFNVGTNLVLNVSGEISITQALGHTLTPGSFVTLVGVGTGILSYLTPAEVLTALGITGDTIYTADGTLEENRTVTGAGNSLNFTGIGGFTVFSTDVISLTATQALNMSSSLSTIINTPILSLNINGDDGTAGDVLTADGLGGCSWVAPAGGPGANTIYSANDVLVSNRVVGGAGFNLTFNNTGTSTFTSNTLTVIGSNTEINILSAIIDLVSGGIGLKFELGDVFFGLPSATTTPAGALIQAIATNTGEIDYTPYLFPLTLGAGDDGKGLVYDHGTTSFVMTPVADTNFAEDDLTFSGTRTHDMGVYSLVLNAIAGAGEIQFIMGSGDFLATGNGMRLGLNNTGGEIAYIISHSASGPGGKKELVRAGAVGGLPGGLTRGIDIGAFSDTTSEDPTGGVPLELIRIHELGIEIVTANAQHVININNVANYATNAAAIIGGLVVGDIYRNGGQLMIVI